MYARGWWVGGGEIIAAAEIVVPLANRSERRWKGKERTIARYNISIGQGIFGLREQEEEGRLRSSNDGR